MANFTATAAGDPGAASAVWRPTPVSAAVSGTSRAVSSSQRSGAARRRGRARRWQGGGAGAGIAGDAPSRKEPAAPVQPSRQVSTGPRARRAATLSGSTGSTRPLSRIAQARPPAGPWRGLWTAASTRSRCSPTLPQGPPLAAGGVRARPGGGGELVPDQLAVGVAVGAGRFGAEAAELVGLVVGEVALEPHHPAVAFEGQHVGGDPVQEPAVVADHDRAAGEVEQGALQRAEGVDVQVVGGLVEQQEVPAL